MKKVLVWLKKNWYVPIAAVVGVFLFVVTLGKRSPWGSVFKDTREIKDEAAEKQLETQREADSAVKAAEEESKGNKAEISKATEEELESLEKKVDTQLQGIEGDSEAINSELNDLV